MHTFASDTCPHARSFISDNHCIPSERVYHAVADRPVGTATLLYITGPPCQPWSSLGEGRAANDDRSAVFTACVDYIVDETPPIFIIENVQRLASSTQRPFLLALLVRLANAGYDVHWTLLDARDHGLPQSRVRLFIVGILLRFQKHAFLWPEPVTHPLTVADILAPPNALDDPTR